MEVVRVKKGIGIILLLGLTIEVFRGALWLLNQPSDAAIILAALGVFCYSGMAVWLAGRILNS